jgi:hypothetical protein
MAYTANIALEVQQDQLAAMSDEELRELELQTSEPEADEEDEDE